MKWTAQQRRNSVQTQRLACALVAAALLACVVGDGDARLNVLYLLAHDVRGDFYGPALDGLAREGVRFPLAFANAPFCAPSRHSFLTGRRPAVTGVHTFSTRPDGGRWLSLAGAFRAGGYDTASVGHTLGTGGCSNCWTRPPQHAVASSLRADKDAEVLGYARALLRAWARTPTRWFLCVGFVASHEPHRPTAQLLARSQWRVRNATAAGTYRRTPPRGANGHTVQTHGWGLGAPSAKARAHALHNALAAYTGVDAAVGTLLADVRASGDWNRTVVVFHADHGLSIGEYGTMLIKGKLLDVDCRVPLVVRVPGARFDGGRGRAASRAVVELVDLFPTVADAAGLPRALWALGAYPSKQGAAVPRAGTPPLAGRSLLPLLVDPTDADAAAVGRVVSTYARCEGSKADWPCLQKPNRAIEVMGTSVRTLRWRYTIWCRWDGIRMLPACAGAEPNSTARFRALGQQNGGSAAQIVREPTDVLDELYAMPADAYDQPRFDLAVEVENVVDEPRHAHVRRALRALAMAAWDGATSGPA